MWPIAGVPTKRTKPVFAIIAGIVGTFVVGVTVAILLVKPSADADASADLNDEAAVAGETSQDEDEARGDQP